MKEVNKKMIVGKINQIVKYNGLVLNCPRINFAKPVMLYVVDFVTETEEVYMQFSDLEKALKVFDNVLDLHIERNLYGVFNKKTI